MRSVIQYNTKLGQTADAALSAKRSCRHLDRYVKLVSFRSSELGDGKLTTLTVLRGRRRRFSARSIVSLPNISLQRIRRLNHYTPCAVKSELSLFGEPLNSIVRRFALCWLSENNETFATKTKRTAFYLGKQQYAEKPNTLKKSC